ncbi:glycosyltransferase [Bosea sp. CS1GBMeth4]|uniref:glycosyltransferase n=1 Tax=Bosea sp. CS1GBMeth4 TaxID=1892849 RepID=UPI0032AF43AA
MLTWSDWHTEPRSNRHHYAVRFARRWPTFFVQTNGHGDAITFEPVAGHDITIVRIGPIYSPAQAARLAAALRERGVSRPLVWLYNLFIAGAVARLHPAAVVYHATEDYLAKADSVSITANDLSGLASAAIRRADLVVAVSEGVAESHRLAVPAGKPVVVLPNGCDFAFWQQTGASDYRRPAAGKVALFQGGINGRLDFPLLIRLTELLPDWQFWFCGKAADGGDGWVRLQRQPNVKYHGLLDSAGIAELARQSRVGLIPFKDSGLMRRSLPLKAYEYLACGLPVVTTPIDALADRPDLFAAATDADGFAEAIRRLESSREDAAMIASRLEAASRSSYDIRFDDLLSHLDQVIARRVQLRPALNVLMLYDDRSAHVSTVAEHLEGFRKHSRHRFFFLPATEFVGLADSGDAALDLSCYDALIVHYSVRVSVRSHLSSGIAAAVAAYRGPKLLFVQDEYDNVETTRRWMERLGIDALYTTVPRQGLDFVYPRARFPKVDFIPTLTGYVPEDPSIDAFAMPMSERRLRIAYRGRSLSHHYGALAREKYSIGVDVKRLAQARGVAVDIEVDEGKRIYGSDWYRFIGSARATLGTESGSNVFDIDGRLAKLAHENKGLAYEAFAERYLKEHEGLVTMNQVSPKIFEAIRLRTALVLFDGEYSGVVRADDHYIPLAKDYSNIDEVLSRLEDVDFLEAMTARAYEDVIATGRYSLRGFVEGVDDYLSQRAMGRRRATLLSTPVAAIYDDEAADLLLRPGPDGMLLSDVVLAQQPDRDQVARIGQALAAAAGGKDKEPGNTIDLRGHEGSRKRGPAFLVLRALWRALPERLQVTLLDRAQALLGSDDRSSSLAKVTRRFLRAVQRRRGGVL